MDKQSGQDLTFLAGGGEMGDRIRAFDWSRTPLGSPERWPQSLRSLLSMLLPSKAQIILFWGPEFIVFYNDAYRPVFGAKHPKVLGLPGRAAWSEIWDNMLHDLLAGVVRTGEAFWAKDLLFLVERYGFLEETYFDVSYDPVRVESGGVGGVYCIVTETTERVVSERRMALLKDLAARNAAARTSRDACVLAMETLAVNPEDIQFALAYVGDELQSCTPEAPGKLAGARRELVKELFFSAAAPGGRTGKLVVGLNPQRPLDKQYGAFLELVADQLGTAVTNARAYEEERKRVEVLAELDRAKTAFFSNVSHEFRTPLTLMLGPLETLLDRGKADLLPAVRSELEVVNRNGRRLMRLVNNLLDFSRIEAGRVQASYVATDLSVLTADLASCFRSATEAAGLQLKVDCPPLAEPVYVDREMWEKIVLNLVSNAFKFTFVGEIAVTLRAVQSAVELSVRDTGTGIPVDAIPRLFERFYRVEGAHGRTYEGSGIGLALVQELVRLHGGAVRVESKQGQGTTFIVTLPFGREHLPQDRINASSILASTATGATPFVEEALRWLPHEAGDSSAVLDELELGRPRSMGLEHARHDGVAGRSRILLADDNADMRVYLARLLAEQFEVEAVGDGLAALEAARLRKPDLMLADVMMPRLDGIQLLQALRADAATASIPCILLSARAGEEARVDGIRAGADDYLTKPFSARELMARVDAHIKLARTRRDAEQALRLRTVQFEALFNQAPLGVYLVDADFCIREVNPIALPVFGDIPGGVRGRDFEEIIHILWAKNYANEVVRIFRHTLETGEPYVTHESAEFRLDRGVTEYYEWRLDRITFPDGRYGLACYFRDISERVQGRLLLEHQAEELHRANRVKDEFLAMLGHELRNPLSPITTALQLMRLRGAQSREQEIIERQVGHLTRLVDDLLDVSRITRGAVELRKRPMELAEAVVRSIEIASPLLEQRRHRLEVDVARMGLGVLADEGRLAQILSNLLTNAAKYSEIGSRIELKARRDADHVVVSVKDEGIGIEPENVERIFGLFVQEPQTAERSRGGLGLGLAIVRNLVELHGGTVRVRSEGSGQGSEFTVTLPAITLQSVPAAKPEPIADKLLVRPDAKRVLVVDDNADAAMLLKEALEANGYTVVVAEDGPSALESAVDFRPEVALLDIGLPVMDGYELGRRLRHQHKESRKLRLIAVTGYGLQADKARSAAAGFDAHLVKPIDLDNLKKVVG